MPPPSFETQAAAFAGTDSSGRVGGMRLRPDYVGRAEGRTVREDAVLRPLRHKRPTLADCDILPAVRETRTADLIQAACNSMTER
jgi:hypothetical protein